MTDGAVTSEAGVRVDHAVSVGRQKGRSMQGEELLLEGRKKFCKLSPRAVTTATAIFYIFQNVDGCILNGFTVKNDKCLGQ